jgi:xanthine/uracil/vitamin C permease (AzgA family)
MFADALGTVGGALLGTSTVTNYIESASGIAHGARTGPANVSASLLKLVSGKGREVHWVIYLFAVLFIIRYIVK